MRALRAHSHVTELMARAEKLSQLPVGPRCKSNSVSTHSLKATGFKPLHTKPLHINPGSKTCLFQIHNLRHYVPSNVSTAAAFDEAALSTAVGEVAEAAQQLYAKSMVRGLYKLRRIQS